VTDLRDRTTLPSPTSDVSLPPYARRLDVRATRAAFAAGTLGPVGDDGSSVDEQRSVELRHADRHNADVMDHGVALAQNPARGEHTFVPMTGPGSNGGARCAVCWRVHDDKCGWTEAERQAFLRRVQYVDPRERRA